MRWSALLLVACTGGARDPKGDDSEPMVSVGTTTGETDPFTTDPEVCDIAEGEFTVVADHVGDGVLLSAWSNGPGEVLFVGGDLVYGPGVLVRYDGASLCTESAITERALWWIHGPTEGEWYAVGDGGTILHDVGGVRTREDVATDSTLYGVYASADQVWAVGGDPFTANSGEIWRKTNGTWTQVRSGLPGVVFKVWGDLFVGAGVAYRWDGTDFVDVSTPDRLLTVRGRSATDAFAVGGVSSPAFRHWDGTAWATEDTTGLYSPLNGVWTDVDQDVWVAGFDGLMARWDGASWTFPSPPITLEVFHSAWGHCNEVVFAGGNLMTGPPYYGTIGRFGPAQGNVPVSECP